MLVELDASSRPSSLVRTCWVNVTRTLTVSGVALGARERWPRQNYKCTEKRCIGDPTRSPTSTK
jgi:hypothetical protein